MARAALVVLAAWLAAAWPGGACQARGADAPPDLGAFFAEARARRLALERQQVAEEIRQHLLWDSQRIEQAVQILFEDPASTPADNVERICRAFARADERFARALDQDSQGLHAPAAEAFAAMLSRRESGYFTAAKMYCWGRALAGAGEHKGAVRVFVSLVLMMPERFSFASESLLAAGANCEKVPRRLYAVQLYRVWVEEFGPLDADRSRQVAARADRIAADLRDPYESLAGRMAEVQRRLAEGDSGPVTQQMQKEIVSVLDDLIADPPGQPNDDDVIVVENQPWPRLWDDEDVPPRPPPPPTTRPGTIRDADQDPAGRFRGRLTDPGSRSPARDSVLPPGTPLRPPGQIGLPDGVRLSDLGTDWGRLPPRERERLLVAFKAGMPQRYRDIIRDYYRSVAAEPGR